MQGRHALGLIMGPWNFRRGWPVLISEASTPIAHVEVMMRTFVGMILGCLLMVAAAYIHDTTYAEGGVNGSNAIVNWNVAAREWNLFKQGVETTWLKVQTLNDGKSPKSGA